MFRWAMLEHYSFDIRVDNWREERRGLKGGWSLAAGLTGSGEMCVHPEAIRRLRCFQHPVGSPQGQKEQRKLLLGLSLGFLGLPY